MKFKVMRLVCILMAMGIPVCGFAQRTGPTRTGNGTGTGPVLSQQPPGGTNQPPLGGTKTSDDAPDGTTGDRVEQNIVRTAHQLGLTSEQRTALASALKGDRTERTALAKTLQEARRALSDALANGQTFLDSEIENLSSASANVQKSDLKLWAKLYAILVPDQQRRLLSMSTPLSQAAASQGTMQGQQ